MRGILAKAARVLSACAGDLETDEPVSDARVAFSLVRDLFAIEPRVAREPWPSGCVGWSLAVAFTPLVIWLRFFIMIPGVTDRLWSVADLAVLVENVEAKLGKRGPYKKQAAARRVGFVAQVPINDPKHWRQRAKEARTIADAITNLDAKRKMLRIADGFEELAKRAEKGLEIQSEALTQNVLPMIRRPR